MKLILIFLLWVLVPGAQASLDAVKTPQLVFPADNTVKFVSQDQPFTAWLFERWSGLGYSVPKEGDTFRWGDIAQAVNPVNVKVDDCVAYSDKDEVTEALVISTDLKDPSMIAVVEPLPGMLLYHAIERKAIQGVCRPFKRVKEPTTFFVPPPPYVAFFVPPPPVIG